MDSTLAPDEAAEVDELREVVRHLRTQLGRRAQLGGWAVPGGASPRLARGSISDAPIPLPIVDDEPQLRGERRTLAQIAAEVGDCQRCKLSQRRNKIVFGVGAERAPLVFVGEAPGEQEDRRGEPFVGAAGELLDKMIVAMGWTRDTVYITNVVMCRPPGNRNPEPDELASCMPFLHAKFDALAPRIVVALGRPAANNILGTDAPISALRGKFHDRHGFRVMPTFHPAYLLREDARKRDTWNDLKLVIAELERLGIHAPNPPRV
ncbi:MAG TPA: uracil-DNA glycosylase [Byssovorax sp.]|jgi:DNA polymerase